MKINLALRQGEEGEKMNKYWLSWICEKDDMGKFELHYPWWISGYDAEDNFIICAAIKALSERKAKDIVYASYDKEPKEIKFRFCDAQDDDFSPFCERFPKAKWMKWA